MTTGTLQRFTVFSRDDDSGALISIGQVDVGPDSKFTLVSAVPGREEFLTDLIEEMNGDDEMHVEAPPPAGAVPYAVYTKPVHRRDPGFFDALKDYLAKYYDVTLTPA